MQANPEYVSISLMELSVNNRPLFPDWGVIPDDLFVEDPWVLWDDEITEPQAQVPEEIRPLFPDWGVLPGDLFQEDPWRLWDDELPEGPQEVIEEAQGPEAEIQDQAPPQVPQEEAETQGLEAPQEEDPSCSVCMMEYGEGETPALLVSCGHHFHWDCINPWLERSDTCPLCRGTIPEMAGIDICTRDLLWGNPRSMETDMVAALRLIAEEEPEEEPEVIQPPRRRRRRQRRARPY